jgi:lipoate-protein ligase A
VLPYSRLIVDAAPQTGGWNMAVDEALLESTLATGVPVVRAYGWSRPTISLGYFQEPAELASLPELAGLDVVRRLTGGGALVHHHEWTYSCTLPPGRDVVGHPYDLYDLVHSRIAGWLTRELGFSVRLRGDAASAQRPEPVLCFSRQDSHDLVYGPHKVLGSAQRRRKGALLQHGSLLLRTSAYTPQYPGLLDLSSAASSVNSAALARSLAEAIAVAVVVDKLSAGEHLWAEQRCLSPARRMSEGMPVKCEIVQAAH